MKLITLSICFTFFCISNIFAHESVFEEMSEAANRLLVSLNQKEKALIQFKWKDSKRNKWHFLPDKYIRPDRKRYGLRLDQMSADQKVLLHAFLATGLSAKGYLQAATIMAFEQLLHEMENGNPIRNPELYYVSIFGTPSKGKTWSWRFEGHHLSINITLVDGQHIRATPSFWASNPGKVKQGRYKGLKLLDDEEDMARAFVLSLNKEQQSKAIIMKSAPRDILTSDDRKVNRGLFDPKKGIRYSELNTNQQKELLDLIKVYTKKYRPELLKVIEKDGPIAEKESLIFAWGGHLEEGKGHYYRIQSNKHLIEYDNVQNGARHVHAVWRMFDGDFGEDVLRKHHEEHHNQ